MHRISFPASTYNNWQLLNSRPLQWLAINKRHQKSRPFTVMSITVIKLTFTILYCLFQ